tara:strand:+ start:750 stop:1181 length:432 start_codon:yes stop_codon:yes gene_type:complete
MSEKKTMTLFDWVNEVKTKKRKWESFSESDHKTFSPYMIHRFLSMNQDYIQISNDIQKYWLVDAKEIYEFYCEVLPKHRTFDKYIKAKKTEKYPDWVIDILCKYFNESKAHIEEYLYLIEKSELKNILEMYGTEPKEIKKLKL